MESRIVSLVLELADECAGMGACSECPIHYSGGGCLLKNKSLLDIPSLIIKRGTIYIRCRDKEQAVILKKHFDPYMRKKTDEYSLRLIFFANDTKKSFLVSRKRYGFDAIKKALNLVPEEDVKVDFYGKEMENVRLVVESDKDVGYKKN